MGRISRTLMLAVAVCTIAAGSPRAQSGGQMSDSVKATRWTVENELASLAIIERKVMIPMRNGVRIAADVYHPKDASRKYPAIWVRTPYNFNYSDVANGVPRDMTAALTAIKRGYVRPQPQHRRTELRRGHGRRGAQRVAPLGEVPIVAHRDRREAAGSLNGKPPGATTRDRANQRLGGDRERAAPRALQERFRGGLDEESHDDGRDRVPGSCSQRVRIRGRAASVR